MHFIPGCRLRASEEAEILGIDDAEMGEFAYDYVGLEQEIGHTLDTGTVATGGAREPDHHIVNPDGKNAGAKTEVSEVTPSHDDSSSHQESHNEKA